MKIFRLIINRFTNWQWANHQVWNRSIWVLVSSLIFGVLFFPLYYFWGPEISLLSLFPAGLSGWYFGPMMGVIIGVCLTFFNGVLFSLVGMIPTGAQFLTWIAIDLGFCCLAGYLAGRWNEHRYQNQSHLLTVKEEQPGKHRWEAARGDFEALVGNMIEAIPEAVLVTDRAGNIIHWNKAIESLTGIEASQVFGKSCIEVTRLVFKEDRLLPIEEVLGLAQSSGKEYVEFQHENQCLLFESFFPKFRQGGAYLNLRASPLFNFDGLLVGAMLIIQDVTEKRLMQERQAIREQRDKSTGLFSWEYLEKEISRLELRESFPNSVILIRLGRESATKQPESSKGKDDGGTRKFATQLQAFFRVTDTVTFLGDQDFAVLIPKANSGVAQMMAERLRKSLATQTSAPAGNLACSIVSVTAMEAGKLKETIQQGRQLLGKS